jgi:phosphatidylserine/phosphatidylglycerophosphate/cardiolipin synthase-like enzyme
VKEPLLSLAPAELRELAVALKAGRIGPPYSPVSLERFVRPDDAVAIASRFETFSQTGSPPQAIAQTLELIAMAIDGRPPVEDQVAVVTSGPDSAGDWTRDTEVVVGELFRQAENKVIVVGFAVHKGQQVFQELARRMVERPELQVQMYLNIHRRFGDTSAPEELVIEYSQRFRAKQWPLEVRLPEVYYDERSIALDQKLSAALHAKCIIVDEHEVFVSSANFTEAAQKRNLEIGLVLRSPAVARRITSFLQSLRRQGLLKRTL